MIRFPVVRATCICVLSFWSLCLLAQAKKPVTKEMAFAGKGTRLTLTIDRHDGWFDADHYLWVVREGEQTKTYKVNAASGERTVFEKPAVRGSNLQKAPDQMAEVWIEKGDLYHADLGSGVVRQLTRSDGEEKNPRFSPDGAWIAYTRNHNLFAMALETGLEVQLTADGSDTIYNGYASWVYYEEILGRSSRYRAFWWSPDSQKILFMRFDDSTVKTFPIYHTPGNYGELEVTRYPKAGEDNPQVRMGVVNIGSGDTVWMDYDETADHYIAWPFWLPDSKRLHVQWMNRDQDHLILYEHDVANGEKKPVYEEKQDAWVEFFNDILYLKDGSGFLLRSDKDGRHHLYLHNMDGSLRNRLTSGDWTVSQIMAIDQERASVYFTGDKENSTGKGLYAVGLNGRNFKTILPAKGNYRPLISPGFDYVLASWSDQQTPNQIRLHDIEGKVLRQLADSTNPQAASYKQAKVEMFTIPAPDGTPLPAWWMIPADLDRSGNTKYAVIFRIYSGPGSATVRDIYRWQWRDHWYANNGVITLSLDHRGSGHFGKAGIAKMYRRLGFLEIEDLAHGVEWLREKPFIDPTRIGITGHSYGGYITLLALAKAPDHFTHGVAGAPVTDWRLYDTVYTERYMDRPQDNPDGYREGNVMAFADQMKGELRLIHGTIDDNVHMQNSLQLVAELTKHGLLFEFMVYPGSRHGIRQRDHRMDSENAFWLRHFLNQSLEKSRP